MSLLVVFLLANFIVGQCQEDTVTVSCSVASFKYQVATGLDLTLSYNNTTLRNITLSLTPPDDSKHLTQSLLH